MAYVYRMYVNDEIKYIGHTTNMGTRMSVHFGSVPDRYERRVLTVEQGQSVTRVDYVETGMSNARVLEAYLIAKYNPEWNKDFNEDDVLTFELITGELEWKEWEVCTHDNPHHHIFVWKDGELLYEIPKIHSVYDALCKELGIEQDMNFGYSVPVYANGYKLMRLSEKRYIKTGNGRQMAKYSFMGYPEEWDGKYENENKNDTVGE